MKNIIQNLELVLTAAGMGVIFVVHSFWGKSNGDGGSWMVAGITAIAVGVIHGMIFWLVRRRQRVLRSRALDEARRMLKDIINNQLSIIQFSADMQQSYPEAIKDAHGRITESVGRINRALNNISEESLNLWKQKYPASSMENEASKSA